MGGLHGIDYINSWGFGIKGYWSTAALLLDYRALELVQCSIPRGAQVPDRVGEGGEGIRKPAEERELDEAGVTPVVTAINLRRFRAALVGPPQEPPNRRRANRAPDNPEYTMSYEVVVIPLCANVMYSINY